MKEAQYIINTNDENLKTHLKFPLKFNYNLQDEQITFTYDHITADGEKLAVAIKENIIDKEISDSQYHAQKDL